MGKPAYQQTEFTVHRFTFVCGKLDLLLSTNYLNQSFYHAVTSFGALGMCLVSYGLHCSCFFDVFLVVHPITLIFEYNN